MAETTRQMVEAVFARMGRAHPTDEGAQQSNARIRTLHEAGYQFRRQRLYAADGAQAGMRLGVFDCTGPRTLIEERVYDLHGQRRDGLLHTLVDVQGKAPIGW